MGYNFRVVLVYFSVYVYLSRCARVLSNTGDSVNSVWTKYNQNGNTVPSPFTSAQRSLPAIKVDPLGKVYTTQILKQQLANELGLPLRDLRIVDPSFPSQIQATFTARPRTILFCVENIKVVVQQNEALVFSPYQAEVQEFIPALQQQILSMGEGPAGAAAARFESIVIETALNVAIQTLFRRVRSLSPAVASALNGLRAESRGLDVVQTQVDELLPLKNKLDELRKRVKEIKRAITEVLASDEDMAMMQLGGASASKEQQVGAGAGPGAALLAVGTGSSSKAQREAGVDMADGSDAALPGTSSSGGGGVLSADEDALTSAHNTAGVVNLEMMFENYLNEVEWISAEVEDEIDEIRNTEENVVLQLDLLRNRILKFELLLSISSFVVTCGALVTGLFGMNLFSHLETNGFVFYVVTAVLAASMAGGFLSFTRYARREKLF